MARGGLSELQGINKKSRRHGLGSFQYAPGTTQKADSFVTGISGPGKQEQVLKHLARIPLKVPV
jgi:hypothetical protein